MIRVSNIERFATHDGPGIRTTVFLKGCSLHCPWCANPETWTIKPVVMYRQSLCAGCRVCEQICQNKAIHWDDVWHIDRLLCRGCGNCVSHCAQGALSINGEAMDEKDVIAVVLRDLDYYLESNGGVTFSGGEPLVHLEGLGNLLRLAKEAGLHVAVETTGNYSLENLMAVEKDIDLFLFDLKHVDKDRLTDVTGADAEKIFASFEYLTELRSRDVIARIPVIPGFNETAVDEIISYALSKNVREVNLLPFHNLGKDKWRQLQKEYAYENNRSLGKESLQRFVRDKVTIGG